MERRIKLWQALVAAVLAALGSYFGTQPKSPADPPANPQAVAPQIPEPKPAVPEVAPPPKPAPKPDPVNAIGRIQFGNAGCTATVIGPRRPDGRWDVLTAAHCVVGEGQHGTMKFKDGRLVGVVVVSLDRRQDACWLVTESNDVFPFAHLAEKNPAIGSKVWHMGYGVHIPGNREDGTVTANANSDGQIEFRLSVSSGDSGGGIALNENGEIVGAVCCTTARNQVARVWACSPETAAKLRAAKTDVSTEWTPLEIPLVVPEIMQAK